VLATVVSAGVVLGIAGGIGFSLALLIFLAQFDRVPRIAVGLVAAAAVLVMAVGAWAALRTTSSGANPPMVAATPLSTPTVSPLAPGPSPSPSGPGPTPSASGAACHPSGPPLTEVAKNTAYLSSCLQAPAGQAFTISFENQDAGIAHSIHVFSADPTTDPNAPSVFAGQIVTGPAAVGYHVQALQAGTYFFHCDVHPTTMTGTLVVGS